MAYKINRTDEHIVLPDGPASAREVRRAMKQQKNPEFYELEPAEVIKVYLDEEDLPKLANDKPDYSQYGFIEARMCISNDGEHDIILVAPLEVNIKDYPYPGEYVIVVEYFGTKFYTQKLNLYNNVDTNILPGLSKIHNPWKREGYKDNLPKVKDRGIRQLKAEEGDITFNGRFGNSIRFGSNVKIIKETETTTSNGHTRTTTYTGKKNSPNIIIRAGQGVQETVLKKPVHEDINADGSSIWMTTDQSVKLDIEGSNAVNHVFMTSKQSDDQPKNGGKQIVLNSDRITFNTKQGKILGFSHDVIGFSTQKSFTVDADETLDMNVGGGSGGPGSTLAMTGTTLLMTSPTNAGLSIGEDRAILSSPCPSILTLADYANITACEGAQLHLDDCAGIKDNQGSFLRVGGKALGITGYVFGRDDMGQQHLVYGEELTNILDSICNSFVELGETILNLAGIPTGAGPSGPISGGPTNTPAIEAWKAGVETIRARLCNLLMKPEDDNIPSI